MSGTALGAPRVLVVDDEPLVVDSLQLVLSGECSVKGTTEPTKALSWVREGESFDVILCDVMMPDLNGVELRDRIATFDEDQAARIVFMTGGILLPHVRNLLDRVPNVWIEKPIHLEGLRDLIRRRTRPIASTASEALAFAKP